MPPPVYRVARGRGEPGKAAVGVNGDLRREDKDQRSVMKTKTDEVKAGTGRAIRIA